MPKPGKHKLNPAETAFVDAYARTNDTAYALAKAGYSEKSSGQATYMLKKPMVRDALQARQMAFEIYANASPKAAQKHVDRLLGQNGQPEPSNKEFASLISAFNGALAKHGAVMQDIPVEEMNADQLRQSLAFVVGERERVEAELAARAKLIEGVEVRDDARKPEGDDEDETDIFA